MLKNKYQRLTKEEQKKTREAFYQTKTGQILKVRFTRLLITSLLLLIYGSYLIIDAIMKDARIFGITSGIILYIFAFVFLIGRHKLIIDKVNKFLIEKK